MTRPRARFSIGPLTVLALLLAASGAIRFGEAVGTAMALQAEKPQAADSAPLDCPAPPARLLEALRAREGQIAAREAALNDRQAAISMADEAISARIAELTELEASLTQTLSLADGAAERDLTNLTAVYEAMKPADAAALFETMAPEFAAGFLGRMRPDAAAAILSGMKSEAAYSISVLVAGRNATVPKE